jgi:hypothetical protein
MSVFQLPGLMTNPFPRGTTDQADRKQMSDVYAGFNTTHQLVPIWVDSLESKDIWTDSQENSSSWTGDNLTYTQWKDSKSNSSTWIDEEENPDNWIDEEDTSPFR